MNLTRGATLAAMLIASTGACHRGNDGAAGAPAMRVDTTNTDALDGMSTQQVEAKAEALTPEQAAARGLAEDSSIHVASPTSDSAQPGPPAARPDTARPRPVAP